jgi:hypothetical protein
MDEREPNTFLRFLAVLAITLIVTTPLAIFFFLMGLVVSESVIYPTATLATAAISAVAASWAASSLSVGEERTNLAAVAVRNLFWAAVPAVASIFFASSIDRSILLIVAVIGYTSVTASILATRHRTAVSTADYGKLTVSWLVGTMVGVGVVMFVASLFGLAGA